MQIRVLPSDSNKEARFSVDLLGWVGDSRSLSIQPLSFSPLYGFGGVLVVSEIAANPILAAALLAALLADRIIDWSAFDDLSRKLENLNNSAVREFINRGTRILQKAYDDLEKPARELGIIDRKTKDTSTREKGSTREYTKPGGQEALDTDFDKFDGEVTPLDGGVDMKTLPNGNKVVKRSETETNKTPTLEIQPRDTGNKPGGGLRVKIRYPKL